MQLSVILVNYRGWKKLRPCLESLKCLSTLPIDSEIIIVDNQSADGELTGFARDFPDFNFIENTGNFGFAHGCNYGASAAKGDFLMFLNPDTIVNAEAIQQLRTTASKYANLTILTCRQVTTGQTIPGPMAFS
jgi:GT2 family glycosyltransferase